MFSDLVLQAIAICADLIKGAMEKDLKFSRGTSVDAYRDVEKVNVTALRIDESHCQSFDIFHEVCLTLSGIIMCRGRF
jgi:hypothetical protein